MIDPHCFRPSGYNPRQCFICRGKAGDRQHLGTLEGMETAVAEQEHAAALQQAEDLAEEMKKPLGDINRKAGNMEENSPLFYGEVNATLF